jgi:RNA polymerase III RPC4
VKTEHGPPIGIDPSNELDSQHPKSDGIIGQLEIYRSGVVKMRLANGILLDVCHIRITELMLLLIFLAGKCGKPTLLPSASGVC